MEKFSQKWALASLFSPIEDGTEYFYQDFPLHVTLAGVFAVECDGKTLAKQLSHVLQNQKSIALETDKEDRFGPNQEVGVMKLQKTPELMILYKKLYDSLEQLGVIYNEPQYEGEGYIPHSTFQKHGRLKSGDKITIDSISIVDLFPNGNHLQRKIFITFQFNTN